MANAPSTGTAPNNPSGRKLSQKANAAIITMPKTQSSIEALWQ